MAPNNIKYKKRKNKGQTVRQKKGRQADKQRTMEPWDLPLSNGREKWTQKIN